MNFVLLFLAKFCDNIISTEKSLLVQKNKAVAASIVTAISQLIFYILIKQIVADNSFIAILIVSIASGFGSWVTFFINNKFSKEKTYVNVILSDDIAAMMELRDFLARNKITNVASDSYTIDWDKTISVTAYAETKEQSKMIDEYLGNSETKFKRVVQGEKVKKV